MGLMGQINHTRVQNAINSVFQVGKELEVVSGIWRGAGKTIKDRLNEGWQMVALGMDIDFLLEGAKGFLGQKN